MANSTRSTRAHWRCSGGVADPATLRAFARWRVALARAFALPHDPGAPSDPDNLAQQTILQLVVLRMAEMQGLEPPETLQALLHGDNTYARLRRLCAASEARHAYVLLDPPPAAPLPPAADQVLQQIIGQLLNLDAPWSDGALLGQIYARLRGAARKAHGIYYTPAPVVDYIVRGVLGRLLKSMTPEQISGPVPLRLLDPACGAGAFLLGAYRFLLDWYRARYLEQVAQGAACVPELCQDSDGVWRLTDAACARILREHIYGVDIDPQALAIARFALHLALREDAGSIRMPELRQNLQCGNALVGPDFVTVGDAALNVFDWVRAFPAAMDAGGFDAIIGNPPYHGGRTWPLDAQQAAYLARRFTTAAYQFDIYALFWEQGLRLLKDGGVMGLITPNTWLNNQSATRLRALVLDTTTVVGITDFSRSACFPGTVVLPVVTILEKCQTPAHAAAMAVATAEGIRQTHSVPQQIWRDDARRIIHTDLREDDIALRQKIEKGAVALETLAAVRFGIKVYETGKGHPPQAPAAARDRIFEADTPRDAQYRPYLEGKDITRYAVQWRQRWLRYGAHLAAPRDPALFTGPRLLLRRIVGPRLIGAYTDADFVTGQLLQIVKPHEPELALYLLGILNSTLMGYYFRKTYNRQDRTFPEIRIYELAALPIRALGPADEARRVALSALVGGLHTLHTDLAAATTPAARHEVRHACAAMEQRIDALVYALYGLNEAEIAVVEGGGDWRL